MKSLWDHCKIPQYKQCSGKFPFHLCLPKYFKSNTHHGSYIYYLQFIFTSFPGHLFIFFVSLNLSYLHLDKWKTY